VAWLHLVFISRTGNVSEGDGLNDLKSSGAAHLSFLRKMFNTRMLLTALLLTPNLVLSFPGHLKKISSICKLWVMLLHHGSADNCDK